MLIRCQIDAASEDARHGGARFLPFLVAQFSADRAPNCRAHIDPVLDYELRNSLPRHPETIRDLRAAQPLCRRTPNGVQRYLPINHINHLRSPKKVTRHLTFPIDTCQWCRYLSPIRTENAD